MLISFILKLQNIVSSRTNISITSLVCKAFCLNLLLSTSLMLLISKYANLESHCDKNTLYQINDQVIYNLFRTVPSLHLNIVN